MVCAPPQLFEFRYFMCHIMAYKYIAPQICESGYDPSHNISKQKLKRM